MNDFWLSDHARYKLLLSQLLHRCQVVEQSARRLYLRRPRDGLVIARDSLRTPSPSDLYLIHDQLRI
jgi:hypothetical protein